MSQGFWTLLKWYCTGSQRTSWWTRCMSWIYVKLLYCLILRNTSNTTQFSNLLVNHFPFGDGPSPSLNFLMYSHVWALLNLHWFSMCFNGYLYRVPGCQSLLFWDSLGGHPLSNDHRMKWYALHLFLGVVKLPPVGSQNLQTCDRFCSSFWEIYQLDGYIYKSQISGIVIFNVKHEIVIRHQAIVVLVDYSTEI